tara:strand:- start:1851 stop:3029 length:1179 start_codon:yes stop_codon:yes gene_type:complete
MKNTHLEHLEDNILNDGSRGGREAIIFLRSLGKMLEQGGADTRVTVKWDGAPAIICGINPENDDFFVGTKSVFNKVSPKIAYSEDDVDKFYPPGQLQQKLKASYRYLSQLGITGVVQGDLLFTNDKYVATIGGDECIAFTPNTITYAVPKNSELGEKINTANLGIVFHTTYEGRSLDLMVAKFGASVQGNSDVFVASAEFSNASGEASMSMTEKGQYNSLINRAEGSLKQSSKFLDMMKGDDKFSLNYMFKIFFNRYVREGKKPIGVRDTVAGFAKYFSDSLDKEVASKKQKKTQDKYLEIKNKGLRFISANQNSLYMTVASYYNLQAAKQFMINRLQKVNTFGTFLKTENGYRVTAPEGFVAIRSGRALKLVDRLEFSRANFTADKNWDKG